MTERLIINYDNLPMHSVWDGSSVNKTANCFHCQYRRDVKKDNELLEICSWGVAWKVLEMRQKLIKCNRIKRDPPKFSSFETIRNLS